MTRIEGAVPVDLRGTLLRNGPGKHDVHGERNRHWFDGDGMLHALHIDAGGVRYQNRFVRTREFTAELSAGRRLYPRVGTRVPGRIQNILRSPKNLANTSVVHHAGAVLAMYDAGLPYAVDPRSLRTLGEVNYGALSKRSFVGSHPCIDPVSGEMFLLDLSVVGRPVARLWRVDAARRAHRLQEIRLRKPSLVHDFALTQSKIIIFAGPLYIDKAHILGWMFGDRALSDCMRWNQSDPAFVYIIDRNDPSQVEVIEVAPRALMHVANAYDDGDAIVMDAIFYPDGTVYQLADEFITGEPDASVMAAPAGTLMRVRICNRKIDFTPLSDRPTDFPSIDPRVATLRHRYVLSQVTGTTALDSKVMRTDVQNGQVRVQDYGLGCFPGEPVFVPRPGSLPEQGWGLVMVYDSRDDHSFLSIVDVANMDELARVHLPFHVPMTLHGTFVPR